MPAYCYVVVRRDLPSNHLVVQACHGVLAATNTFGEPNRTHPNLIVCTVESEGELNDLFNRLKLRGVRCCGWYEPDMGGSLTAVCTAPLRGKERRELRKLRLLC